MSCGFLRHLGEGVGDRSQGNRILRGLQGRWVEGHVGVPQSERQLGEEGSRNLSKIRLNPVGEGYLASTAKFSCTN